MKAGEEFKGEDAHAAHVPLLVRRNAEQAAGDLVDEARLFLETLNATPVRGLLPDWPDSRERRPPAARLHPAVRALERCRRTVAAGSDRLLAALVAQASSLEWRQSYSAGQLTPEFLDNYAWTELVGPRGLVPSGRLACGILLLGPGTHYPAHCHEAYELYVPLAGSARWRQGTGPWRAEPPGSVIEHASEIPHEMQTGEDPLVALYLWRSENLAQSSRLAPP